MRIVAVLDRLAPLLRDRTHLLGGAEREALGHLRALAEQFGHRCHILTPSPVASRLRLGELRLCGYRDLEELKQQLRRLRPVVVFSNLDLVYDAAEISRALGLPHVPWLDSFECAEPTAREKRRWGVSLDRSYLPADKAAFALRSSRRVFAVSRTMKLR